jgi:uncharacterized membrane protein YeaQ/YmgE (transglycosylase-associated protein family)
VRPEAEEPAGVAMLLGVAGALVATFLGRALGWYGPGQGAGFIASVLGAVLLLWIYRKFFFRRATL